MYKCKVYAPRTCCIGQFPQSKAANFDFFTSYSSLLSSTLDYPITLIQSG